MQFQFFQAFPNLVQASIGEEENVVWMTRPNDKPVLLTEAIGWSAV
jgi:hypothetical protein